MKQSPSKNGNYNAKLVSDLLLAAKGPHRTGIEFCKECDISAPTFSRYVNMHNNRPCPIELLQKVAEHADPSSNVTLEQLIEANGGKKVYDIDSQPELTQNEMIGIITTAILVRNYECSYSASEDATDIMGLTYHPDWSIHTDAIETGTNKRWDFFLYNQSPLTGTSTEHFVRQLLILVGAHQLNLIHFDKLTFVFTDVVLYKAICTRTTQLRSDLCISLLFINPCTKQIQNEYVVPSIQNTSNSIFSTPGTVARSKSTLLSVDENNLL